MLMPIFVSRNSEWVELLLNSEDGDLNIDGAALLGTIVRSDMNLETGQVSVALSGSLNDPTDDGQRPTVELTSKPG